MNNRQELEKQAVKELVIKKQVEKEIEKNFPFRWWFFYLTYYFLIGWFCITVVHILVNFLTSYYYHEIPLNEISWSGGAFVFDNIEKHGVSAPWGLIYVVSSFLLALEESSRKVRKVVEEKVRVEIEKPEE